MALWKYSATDDKLVPLTSEGSIGLPVGAVVSFASGTASENWLLCDGRDTTGTADELQTKYPALYTYLGNSNVLPNYTGSTGPLYIKATSAGIEVDKDLYATKGYIRDQNILADYETVTISQDSNNPTIMPYDGFLHVRYNGVTGGYIRGIAVNGVANSISAQAAASDQYIYVPPVEVKKGDRVYLTSSQTPNRVMARYYKLRDYTGR